MHIYNINVENDRSIITLVNCQNILTHVSFSSETKTAKAENTMFECEALSKVPVNPF
jgi:hypothetical protein